MIISYLMILKSRKFLRLICKLSLITMVIIFTCLGIYFDPTCVPKTYQPNITLKSLDDKHGMNASPSDPKWTPIVDNVISIYSSFRIGSNIKIIGLMDQYLIGNTLMCELRQNSRQLSIVAKVTILSESWQQYYRYVSVLINCPIKSSTQWSKVKISFQVNDNKLETDYIPIEDNSKNTDDHKSLVVCVRPLFGPFTSSAEILEFIAYYKANRINSIIFYDLDTSDQIRQLLSDIPFVQLLSYSLPIESSDIHADGQIAALNDCVLRSANHYVIHVDIDELIVTSEVFGDIKGFVEYKSRNESLGALVIPNVMICDEFNPDQRFPRIMSETVRQTSKWEHNDRSKAILLKPLSVLRLGIHTVWEWKDSSVNDNIDPSDASLFHYRSCCRVWQPFYRIDFLGLKLLFLSYEDKVVRDFSVKRFHNNVTKFLANYVIYS